MKRSKREIVDAVALFIKEDAMLFNKKQKDVIKRHQHQLKQYYNDAQSEAYMIKLAVGLLKIITAPVKLMSVILNHLSFHALEADDRIDTMICRIKTRDKHERRFNNLASDVVDELVQLETYGMGDVHHNYINNRHQPRRRVKPQKIKVKNGIHYVKSGKRV